MARLSEFDLKLLRVFRTVVECQGFGGAQAMLNISQGTVSTHIKALEERLGFRLCQRGRQGFRVTEQGAAVFEKTKTLFSALETFESEVGEMRRRLTGTLRVGVVDNTVTNQDFSLRRAIAAFCRRNHEVFVDLFMATPDLLEQELLNGRIQLALGPFPNRLDLIHYQTVYEERHSLYCGKGHPFFPVSADPISKAAIARARFVARSYLHDQDVQTIGDVRPSAAVSNMEAQAILILGGQFIGFLPDHYAEQWLLKGELRKIEGKGLSMTSQFCLATRRGSVQSLVQRTFIGDLRESLAT